MSRHPERAGRVESWALRLQGWFWDFSPFWRTPARRLRLWASLALHRWRWIRGGQPPRVVFRLRFNEPPRITHPAIAWLSHAQPTADLHGQTETSWTTDPEASRSAPFCLFQGDADTPTSTGTLPEGTEPWPAAAVESLLMVAAASDLLFARAGWAPPTRGPTPSGHLAPPGAGFPTLLRQHKISGEPEKHRTSSVVGRNVPHICPEHVGDRSDNCISDQADPCFRRVGNELLRRDTRRSAVVHLPLWPIDRVLQEIPVSAGPRTALFLLPFLAIGGAERLLIDLLEGWIEKYRMVVVTIEPHQRQLGQTVDRLRLLTPHVYTLGDWLPREAHRSAIDHLLRRYRVEALICWNGCVAFYDLAPIWRRRAPELRILNQLYNHEGGWIRRVSRAMGRTIDVHLAVNRPIVTALGARGVPTERIALVHHGVAIPPVPPPTERSAAARAARKALKLPDNKILVGTFVRLHPQKRPFDVLAVARRLEGEGFHFLLVGGGPLEAEIDHELARRPLGHLTRLPFRQDLDTLYAAVDLCLSTSDFEGLPIFLLDALAREIPCVATAVGEIPELLCRGGGRLVQHPGDLDALAEALRSLKDPDIRQLEGAAGRHTVSERFGLDVYRARYEALIFPSRETPR